MRPAPLQLARALAILATCLGLPVSAWGQPTLAETPEVVWTGSAAAALKTRADELSDPVAIYEYVRNEYAFGLYHGSRSNSANTFHASRGNDVDLASLLIAMLRSQGIEARYAVGTVRIEAEPLKSWIGVEDFDLAYSLLGNVGIPNLVKDPGDAYVDLEHSWVQARVPWDHYRGLEGGPIDCTATPQACHWVDLDASFKCQSFPTGLLDLHDTVLFDYDAYYHALDPNYTQPDSIDRARQNPLEIYEEEILAYLRGRGQGESLQDVARVGEVVKEERGVLPGSLPYEVVGPVTTWDSVAARGAGGTRTWEKVVALTVILGDSIDDPNAVEIAAGSALVAEVSTQRLSIAYEGGATPRVVTKLGTTELAVPIAIGVTQGPEGPVGLGDLFHVRVALDVSADTREMEFEDLVIGAHLVVALGDQTSNPTRVHRAAEALLAANETYPVVKDIDGRSFVDENANGVADAEDTDLLEHPQAMEALTGGLLEVAGYHDAASTAEVALRADALFHTIAPLEHVISLMSTVHQVDYIESTPFAILPGGLLIDSGYDQIGPFRVDQPEDFSHTAFDLVAHTTSSMEHEVWTELLGYDAISTVNGIQRALEGGSASLLEIDVSETVDEMLGSYPSFDFTTAIPASYTATQWNLFGTSPWTFDPSPGAQDFFMMRAVVSQSDPPAVTAAYRFTPAQAQNRHDFVESYVTLVDNLEQMIALGQFFPSPQQICPISPSSIFPAVLLAWADDCYFWEIDQSQIVIDEFEFLETANGMSLTANVYRDDPKPDPLKHNVQFVQNDVRGFLYFIEPGYLNRVITPDEATVGPNFRFNVSIAKRFDPSGEVLSGRFGIQNAIGIANGGYTRGDAPIDPRNDLQNYNNSVFTRSALVSHLNNDAIATPSTADPVSAATGNLYLDALDLRIKSRGLDMVLTRTYNSAAADLDATPGPLGPGWTHPFLVHLEAKDAGLNPDDPGDPDNSDGLVHSIRYRDERGGERSFLVDPGSGEITSPKRTYDELAPSVSPGIHELRFRNGTTYVFEGPDLTTPGDRARLKEIRDPYGNFIRLTYNASGLFNVNDAPGVADPLHRGGITFVHTAGQLRAVLDWTGRSWQYGYDADGRLQTVTNAEGHTTTYTYDEQGLLQDVILPEDRDGDMVGGDVRTHYSYYRNGRSFGNANALDQGESLSYDFRRRRTRVSDPRGFVRDYHYDRDGLLTKLREPDGGVHLFDHTDDYLRFRRIDPLGHETAWSYQQDMTVSQAASDTFGNVTLERDPLDATIEAEYDFTLYDQPTRIKDKNGGVHRFIYYPAGHFAAGKLQSVEMESLNGISDVRLRDLTWNPDGTLAEVVEYIEPGNLARRRTTTFQYSPDGLDLDEVNVTGSDGRSRRITYTYDELGRTRTMTLWRRTSPTDPTPIPLTTTYTLDDLDRLIRIEDPLGNRLETEYDGNGRLRERRALYKKPDASFETRVLEQRFYDEVDRLVRSVDPRNGATTRFFYDEAGNITRIIDPTGAAISYEYDARSRRTAVIDANGHRATTVYDAAGRVVSEIDGNGHATRSEYDPLGRTIARTDPLGHRVRFSYYPAGQVEKYVDANAEADPSLLNSEDATLFYEYDELGRLTRVLDALEGETRYEYDLLGNRTKVIDAEDQETEFISDDLGRLIEIWDPIRETPTDKLVRFEYDEADNLIRRTDRKGQVTETTYDLLDRPTRYDFLTSGDSQTLSYDLFGNLQTHSNGEVTYTFGYDDHDRLESKTDSRLGLALAFEYDLAGRVLRRTDYQGATTYFQYDGSGRLVAEENPAYLQVSYHYDPGGRLLNRILSNGARTDYAYDDANRLTSLANLAADGTIVHAATYTHDNVGNIDTVTLGPDLIDYDYDALHRLVSADFPLAQHDRSYTYDAVGNRETETLGGVTFDYVYDMLHGVGNRLDEIRRLSDGQLLKKFLYDDNGAVIEIQDGAGATLIAFGRDDRGRIVSASGPGFPSNAYGYDPRGLRVRKDDSGGANLLHLEGEHLDACYDDTGSLRAKYLRGSVIDEVVNAFVADDDGELQSYTYHHDPLNSVVALTGHAGATEETTLYAPFGEELSSTGDTNNALGFAGRERDADTSLYYYRARYYDPALGRFLSEDPLGFDGGQMNFYVYVGNNPVNATDPTGRTAYQQGHEVKIFGFPTGDTHVATVFVPNDQALWSGDNSPWLVLGRGGMAELGQNNPFGLPAETVYFTASGSTDSYIPGLWNLVGEFNKGSDVPGKLSDFTGGANLIIGEITQPEGMDDTQFGIALMESMIAFNGNQSQFPVNYDFPGRRNPNSTGLQEGHVAAVGAQNPLLPADWGLRTSGSGNPVPQDYFGVGPLPPQSPGFFESVGGFFQDVGSAIGGFFQDVGSAIGGFLGFGDAGGGYVIYPSQPNFNMSERAYAK